VAVDGRFPPTAGALWLPRTALEGEADEVGDAVATDKGSTFGESVACPPDAVREISAGLGLA